MMVHSDIRITMYIIVALRRAAARKSSQYRNRSKREILLFDAPLTRFGLEDDRTWGECVPISPEEIEEKVIRNSIAKQILLALTPREKEAVFEIFIMEHTESQAAHNMGVRQQRVSQLKKNALLRMREECKRRGITA